MSPEEQKDFIVLAVFMLLPLISGYSLWFVWRSSIRSGKKRALALFLGNFCVLAFILSITLLVLELHARYFSDATDSYSMTRITRRWIQRHYVHNNLSVRDNINYNLSKSPDRRRITFLGDSFTVGQGVAEVEDRFVNRVRKQHPEWEVHAIAEHGVDTPHETRAILSALEQGYEADVVVLVYCLNDISDLVDEWGETWERLSTRYRKASFIFKHSFFLNSLFYRVHGRMDPDVRDYFHVLKESYRGERWQEQRDRLTLLKESIDMRGGKFVCVTFPFLHQMENYEYRDVHEKLDELWTELSVPHLDLLPSLSRFTSEELTVNRVDAHPSVTAHRVAAKQISQLLERLLQEEP